MCDGCSTGTRAPIEEKEHPGPRVAMVSPPKLSLSQYRYRLLRADDVTYPTGLQISRRKFSRGFQYSRVFLTKKVFPEAGIEPGTCNVLTGVLTTNGNLVTCQLTC